MGVRKEKERAEGGPRLKVFVVIVCFNWITISCIRDLSCKTFGFCVLYVLGDLYTSVINNTDFSLLLLTNFMKH